MLYKITFLKNLYFKTDKNLCTILILTLFFLFYRSKAKENRFRTKKVPVVAGYSPVWTWYVYHSWRSTISRTSNLVRLIFSFGIKWVKRRVSSCLIFYSPRKFEPDNFRRNKKCLQKSIFDDHDARVGNFNIFLKVIKIFPPPVHTRIF